MATDAGFRAAGWWPAADPVQDTAWVSVRLTILLIDKPIGVCETIPLR